MRSVSPGDVSLSERQNKTDLVSAALTTGYYFNQDRVKPNDGKCSHGGFKFGELGPLDGINKDLNDCRYSPHAPLHGQAAVVALDATVQVFRELRSQLPPAQFRLLMGAGPVVIFGIDTSRDFQLLSGPGARIFVDAIVNHLLMTDQEASKYVLVTFDNGGAQQVLTTTDTTEMLGASSSLGATTDFASCSDTSSLSAIMAGIGESGGGAELFLWTNTAPGDRALVESVTAAAIEKKVRVWSFLWDQRDIFACTEAPKNDIFQQVAAATGGQAFYPTLDDVMTDAALVLAALDGNSGTIAGGGGSLGPGGTTSSSFPIDPMVSAITVSSVGMSTLALRRPDGSTVQAGDLGITLSRAPGRQTITVDAPTAGMWSFALDGAGEYQYRITGKSLLNIESVVFAEPTGDENHPGYMPIPGFPVVGQMTDVHVQLSASLQNPRIELRDEAGAVHSSILPAITATASRVELNGTATVPTVPFSVVVLGNDSLGNPVERMASENVTPRRLRVDPPVLLDDLPLGKTSDLTFVVTNLGTDGLFIVLPSDGNAFIQVPETEFALAAGQSRNVTVKVTAPSSATPGTDNTITLIVTGGTSESSNYASVPVTFRNTHDGGGCGCRLAASEPDAGILASMLMVALLFVAFARRRIRPW
jgi:hypothetical protein